MIFLALLTVLVTTCTFRVVQTEEAISSSNNSNSTPKSTRLTGNITVERCEVWIVLFVILVTCLTFNYSSVVQMKIIYVTKRTLGRASIESSDQPVHPCSLKRGWSDFSGVQIRKNTSQIVTQLFLSGPVQQSTNCWYFFSHFQKISFDLSCKFSPLETVCMKG